MAKDKHSTHSINFLKKTLFGIISLKLKEHRGKKQARRFSEEVLWRFEKAMTINLMYLKDLSEEDMSRIVGTNRFYLSKALRDHYHQNYSQVVNTFRVNHALRLLSEEPFLTVEEIALKSGFGSRSSINRAFKNMLGSTPGEYCQLSRKANAAIKESSVLKTSSGSQLKPTRR